MGKFAKSIVVSRDAFLRDRQGRTFADLVNDADVPLDNVLAFFSCEERQRRMEESEIDHDRAPLAGVVRELESLPVLHKYFAEHNSQLAKRLRQAIGVVVRMIMENRGWKKTGRKGSLGVRVGHANQRLAHNTGGLAFWFMRAERYELADGMPYQSVAERRGRINGTSRRKDKVRATPKQ
jgi:hypothetical protein